MTELWCIRIPGPDDLFAKESKEAAEIAAAEHNKAITEWYEQQDQEKWKTLPPLESSLAVVEPWPWGAESHAEDLVEQSDT